MVMWEAALNCLSYPFANGNLPNVSHWRKGHLSSIGLNKKEENLYIRFSSRIWFSCIESTILSRKVRNWLRYLPWYERWPKVSECIGIAVMSSHNLQTTCREIFSPHLSAARTCFISVVKFLFNSIRYDTRFHSLNFLFKPIQHVPLPPNIERLSKGQ